MDCRPGGGSGTKGAVTQANVHTREPMDRAKRLAEEHIPSLLLKFSAPTIVGLMAQAMYYVVDRVFVGQALNIDALAGITVALPFMLILMALGMLAGFGGAALISIRLGQKNHPEAERALGNGLVLLVAAAVLSTAFGLRFLHPLLLLFGASETALPYARDYLGVIVLGAVFQIVGFGLNAMIRGEGNPKIAMITMLLGVGLNTALAPLFLFGFHWGMKGAAAATVLAQAVSAVWVLAYFLSGASLLRLRVANLRLRWSICGRILAIGSAPFAMQIAACALSGVLNQQLDRYGGDLAIAVWGIIWALFMMVFMPIIGINQGAQPIIGYNYGAQRFDRVKKTLQTAALAASGVAVFGFLVGMVFPVQIIRLFAHDRKSLAELTGLGVHAIRTCMLMLPLVGFQVVAAGYFQAVGKPLHAMILTLSRQVLLLIPAVLILPRLFGLDGIWRAIPVSDFTASAITAVCLLLELRCLGRQHIDSLAAAAPAWAQGGED